MRAYFQLFFSLLIPLSALFIAATTIYYNNQYIFNKALRVGVLFGSIIGVSVSLFTALFLLIMRAGKTPQKSVFGKKKKQTSKNRHQPAEQLNTDKLSGQSHEKMSPEKVSPKNIEQKMMLLMDKDLTFEVALHAIVDQNIGTLTASKKKEEYITVKNNNESLHFSLSKLTRHTTQMVIYSIPDSVAAKKLINYMKEKEHSFLQY